MPVSCKLSIAFYLAAIAVLPIMRINVAYAAGPYDAHTGDDCRKQVNAYYDAIEAKMRREGNDDGAAYTEDQRPMHLAECKALDRILQDERLSPASQRLSSAIADIRKGNTPPDTLTRAIQADQAAILKMPSGNRNRDYYLNQYADYLRYLSLLPNASATAVTTIYHCNSPSTGVTFSDQPCAPGSQAQVRQSVVKKLSSESCTSLRKHIAGSRRAYDLAANALLAGARQVGDGWRTNEAQSQRAASDLRWYTDRARLQGCNAP